MEGGSSHNNHLKWMSLSSGGNGNVSHEPEDDMTQEMIMEAGRNVNLTDPVSIQFPTTAYVDFVPESSTFLPKSRYGDMIEEISSSVKGIHAADGISEVPKDVLYCNSAGKACISKSTDFSLGMDPWKGLIHGTINVIIQLGDVILVGVDSRSTITTSSTVIVGGRQFPYSDSCKKLEEIKRGVVCTLCGDGARVKRMCKYLQRIANDGDFSSLAHDGQQYLIRSREHSDQAEAASYIIGWDKSLKMCRVSLLRDTAVSPYQINTPYAAMGSGGTYALWSLGKENISYNMPEEQAAQCIERALINAALNDICTGGPLQIYSVTKKGCKLVNRFHIVEFVMRSLQQIDKCYLFFIVEKRRQFDFSPRDLVQFHGRCTFLQCLYLGEEQSAWMVYMATFASSQLGEQMFRSCSVISRSSMIRRTVLDGGVHAFVGYASKELLRRACSMRTPECLYDL